MVKGVGLGFVVRIECDWLVGFVEGSRGYGREGRGGGGGWKGFEGLLMLIGLGLGGGSGFAVFCLAEGRGVEGSGVTRNQSLMEVSKCRVDLMGCGGAGWLWLER